ncbi:1271_t:CDS:1, partial [Acaulospora colombiana]
IDSESIMRWGNPVVDNSAVTVWDSPVDDNTTITVSVATEYVDFFQSVNAKAHVEEVIVNSGVLLTAMEEMRKDEVTSVMLEDP